MAVTRAKFKSIAENFTDKTFSDWAKTFTIESLTKTPDGQGGYTEAWATFATITGFIFPNKGKQIIKDGAVFNNYDNKFSFEYVAGIDENMRILFDSEYYNIQSLNTVVSADVWINIYAKKDVAT